MADLVRPLGEIGFMTVEGTSIGPGLVGSASFFASASGGVSSSPNFSILVDGKVVAQDLHKGMTGSQHSKNHYVLDLPAISTGSKVELVYESQGSEGTDSYGAIRSSKIFTEVNEDF